MKSAAVFYSNSGKTKDIACALKARFGCDLYEIEPEVPYGNYLSAVLRAGKEKKNGVIAPVKTEPVDLSVYDIVFVGFPVWYGSMPDFVSEYIKKCSLTGKIVIPFATATATGENEALAAVKAALTDSVVRDYFFTSKVKKGDLAGWMNALSAEYFGKDID